MSSIHVYKYVYICLCTSRQASTGQTFFCFWRLASTDWGARAQTSRARYHKRGGDARERPNMINVEPATAHALLEIVRTMPSMKVRQKATGLQHPNQQT